MINKTNSSAKMPTTDEKNTTTSAGVSYVYNSESPTILITNNYSRTTNKTNVNKMDTGSGANLKQSSITIFTHNSDSEGQAYDQHHINIMIKSHFDRPLKQEYEKDAKTGMKTTTTTDGGDACGDGNDVDGGGGAGIESKHLLHPSICMGKIKREKEEIDEIEKESVEIRNGNDVTAVKTINQYAIDDDVFVMENDDRFYLGTIKSVELTGCCVRFDDGTDGWAKFERIRKLNATQKLPMCVACKKSNDSNEAVFVCERCCRGYHLDCCKGITDSAGIWYCNKCDIANKHRHSETNANNDSLNDSEDDTMFTNLLARPNKDRTHCYCGEKGKWFRQMLQCARCLQWYHQSCTKSLTHPLYFGDRFYLFACSNCNHGEEFVRRLHMKIEDVVHLLLFNLWIHHQKRYYNISNVIVPYAKENWLALQLTPKLKIMTASDIKDEIGRALRTHTMRFKSGKQQLTHWSLKTRAPPEAPYIALPPGPPLSEKYLNDLFYDQARIDFLPRKLCSAIDYVAYDAKMRNIMSGNNYLNFIKLGDNESTDSDDESGENVFTSASDEEILADLISRNNGTTNQRLKNSHASSIRGDLDDSLLFNNSSDYSFNGFEGFSINDTDKKKGKRVSNTGGSMLSTKRGRFRLKPEQRALDLYDSSDDTSSRGTLDSIIPPPKDFRGRNNPFLSDHNHHHHHTRHHHNNGSNNSRLQTSTPKNSNGCGSASGSGSTSNSFNMGFSNSPNGNAIGLRPDNGVRMVRTIKRRLSAKDIRIGPNMEVKRRKVKRRSDNVEVISTVPLQDLPISNAFLPIHGDAKNISITAIRSSLTTGTIAPPSSSNQHKNGLAINDRQQRPHSLDEPPITENLASKSLFKTSNDKAASTSTFSSSIPGSPIKTESQDVSMANLQSTVNQYFGAANRIASGENFVIKGKRLSMDGRIQYLIEWDNV